MGPSGAYEALVDVPSKVFDVDLVASLNKLKATDSLRHIIITRLTPERIATLARVVSACKQPPEVFMANAALQMLREKADAGDEAAKLLTGCTLTTARRGTVVTLGGEGGTSRKELRFVPVPTPRWPDLLVVCSEADSLLFSSNLFSLAVYSEGDQLLFSSNLFSAHVAPEVAGPRGLDDGGWRALGEDWRHYFDCMLAPVARQAAVALEKLDIRVGYTRPGVGGPLGQLFRMLAQTVHELTLGADDGAPEPMEIVAICPMHGPVVKNSINELLSRYAEWTEAQIKAASDGYVAVLYASAYGNTASLAQAISHGITKAGVGVETLNLEQVSAAEVEAALEKASGFVLGSPTLGGHMPTPVVTALGSILRSSAAKRLPCGVYGSFGWSGEAVDMIESRLKDAGFRLSFESIRCKFKPTQQMLHQCEESGTDLAQLVKKEQKLKVVKKEQKLKLVMKERKLKEKATAGAVAVAESTSGKAQALGRVVGTLCVLTARDGDARSGMLASWASFDPPGFTVAVKKDRAVESMLLVGSKFVLNVLAEGKEKEATKQMLKPFKPGEDRFAGIEVQESEKTGAPILPQAASYLECSVVSRMETGDHWVVYATVEDGKVLDNSAQSAVHFRHDSRLKLTGIPTLVKYEDGRFGDRVGPELESAVSPEDIDQVLQEFL
ncbi:hypothetical protein N2152v2_010965 [Parachlorella kessleri]